MYSKVGIIIFVFNFTLNFNAQAQEETQRAAYLDALFSVLTPPLVQGGQTYTPLDTSWADWILRTNELPPNFDSLISYPMLPEMNPINDEDKLFSHERWDLQKSGLKNSIVYWLAGNIPKGDISVSSDSFENETAGKVKISSYRLTVQLQNEGKRFSDKIRIKLYLPDSHTKLPLVLIPCENLKPIFSLNYWLERGIAICLFEPKSFPDKISTANKQSIVNLYSNEFDFSSTMLQAWFIQRILDHISTLSIIDKSNIGIMGFDQYALPVFWASAFDDRFKATLVRNGGAGVSIPFRYTGDKFGISSIESLTASSPALYHPRLRFFVGRENKLPVDVHHFSSLISPRALMFSEYLRGSNTNAWGLENHYRNALKMYQEQGSQDNLHLYYQDSEKEVSYKDQQVYIDFFDQILKNKRIIHSPNTFFDYSFGEYQQVEEEWVFANTFSSEHPSALMEAKTRDTIQWSMEKYEIQDKMRWLFELSSSKNFYFSDDKAFNPDEYPISDVSDSIQQIEIAGGKLFLPPQDASTFENGWPLIIYLHNFNFSNGYKREVEDFFPLLLKEDYAIFAMDLPGFGSKLIEFQQFYQRYPNKSLLGKMVEDVQYSINSLGTLSYLDKEKIYIIGNTLGGKVGVISAALDERIKGVVSINGFNPLRDPNEAEDIEGIEAYYSLYGLAPKLGYFKGSEEKIPVDYDEIIACIAPRSVLICSSIWNKDIHLNVLAKKIDHARDIFHTYKVPDNLQEFKSHDIQRMNPEILQRITSWLRQQISF